LGWRRGQLYAARVVPAAPALTTSPLTLRADSTYLISGGLGALGLQAALMLARHGAGHLVLTARPGTDPARAEAATRQLAVAGAQARVWALDLDDGEAIAAALSELARAPQPLRGIIHAAGVLDDGVIALQSEARFARVFAPKAWAAWHLDRGSRALPLDFFVCFSSAAALLGSGGQANYAAANAFLDSLCHARRAQGLPALSLNWGAWASAGMAAEAAVATRMAGHGVRAIEPAAGEQLLAALLASPNVPPQLGVMPADWARFASQFGGHPPAHLTRLLPAMPAATADFRATFLATWSALAPAQRPGAVLALVRRHLAAVLGSGDGASLGARQRWFDLGLDSLLSLELRNRLEAALGLTLPATVAFDYPTLETMGGFLQQTLEQMESGQPAALDTLSDTALEELLARELGAGGGA
jgi:myxalamid-type polyketide synthase MxaB